MTGGRLRILLVDDDEDDFFLTSSIIEEIYRGQYELDWVSSYDPARRALDERRHDVCLLDYRLGERTGLDLLRELIAAGCATPIILLTGTDDRDIDVEAMQAGAADYLVKGQFDGRLLERAIRYAIGYAVERQRTLEELAPQRGTLRAGRPGRQRRPLGLGPGRRHDLLCPALAVDARLRGGPDQQQPGGVARPGPPTGRRAGPGRDRGPLLGAVVAAPDRVPGAPRRRHLPLDALARPGRARRPGDGRPHGGLADRHHPAQGGRGPALSRRLPRHADRPAQPRPALRPAQPRPAAEAAPRRLALRRPVPRPRRLQAGQRQPRPPDGRPAPDRHQPPARALRARGGYRLPLGRRRVHHPARRRPGRERRAAPGRPGPRGAPGPVLAQRPRAGDDREHRHRAERAAVRPRRGPAPRRRHRDVPGQGRGAGGVTSSSTRRCTPSPSAG